MRGGAGMAERESGGAGGDGGRRSGRGMVAGSLLRAQRWVSEPGVGGAGEQSKNRLMILSLSLSL